MNEEQKLLPAPQYVDKAKVVYLYRPMPGQKMVEPYPDYVVGIDPYAMERLYAPFYKSRFHNRRNKL